MTDERINKLLAACWERLPPQFHSLYEQYAKQKWYYEDVRGPREHKGKGKKGQTIETNNFMTYSSGQGPKVAVLPFHLKGKKKK